MHHWFPPVSPLCVPPPGSLSYVLTPMTWADARAHCQSLGMDLAAMETTAELTAALSLRDEVGGE